MSTLLPSHVHHHTGVSYVTCVEVCALFRKSNFSVASNLLTYVVVSVFVQDNIVKANIWQSPRSSHNFLSAWAHASLHGMHCSASILRGRHPILYGFCCFLFQCVPVCVYRLHLKFQRLDAALLRNISLRIHLFTFISCFVIDLLSI